MNKPQDMLKHKIESAKFVGTWINTYDRSIAIERVVIEQVEGKLLIQIIGIDGGIHAGIWGMVEASPLAKGPEKTQAVAFHATFENNDFKAQLAFNDNKGLLIIAGYFYFKNNPKMNDFFAREFYYKAD